MAKWWRKIIIAAVVLFTLILIYSFSQKLVVGFGGFDIDRYPNPVKDYLTGETQRKEYDYPQYEIPFEVDTPTVSDIEVIEYTVMVPDDRAPFEWNPVAP